MSQAFFTALDAIPEAARTEVAKAAQIMIRDELKARREKVKASAAKEKARLPKAVKRVTKPKAAPAESAEPAAAAQTKRSRKQAQVPAPN